MMVREGLVDGQVYGIDRTYPDAIRPVPQVIPRLKGAPKVLSLHLVIMHNRTMLFADTTVTINSSSEDLADIALLSAQMAEFMDMTPGWPWFPSPTLAPSRIRTS